MRATALVWECSQVVETWKTVKCLCLIPNIARNKMEEKRTPAFMHTN